MSNIASSTSTLINSLSSAAQAVLDKVMECAANGHFMEFNYTDAKGKTSRKVYRFGGDIGAKMERDWDKANPGEVKPESKGNWISNGAEKSGIRQGVMEYNSKVYVRGTDVKSGIHKCLILANMSLD